MVFEDRHHAGRLLAEQLSNYNLDSPVVLALPRGGVPVAYEIAVWLDAPLDILVARKLGAPSHPEYGFGAVAPDNVRIVDDQVALMLGLRPEDILHIEREERQELERRQREYRGTTNFPDLTGHTVIIVDDGLATGVTMRAAIMAAARHQPHAIIVAVPVCSAEAIEGLRQVLRPDSDQILCLVASREFASVGSWYHNFEQLTDKEVRHLLEKARRPMLLEGKKQYEE